MDDSENGQASKASGIGALRREAYFPTLLFIRDFPDADVLNPALSDAIRAERASDSTGIERSNTPAQGGWHSRNGLHQEPAFASLAERIQVTANEIADNLEYDPGWPLAVQDMWAIINPPGSFNTSHVHPNCLWSGVYYVQAPEGAGRISFTDPRHANVMLRAAPRPGAERPSETWTEVLHAPVPGRVIVFPAWLYHAVEPNSNPGSGEAAERIIVSFNLHQRRR